MKYLSINHKPPLYWCLSINEQHKWVDVRRINVTRQSNFLPSPPPPIVNLANVIVVDVWRPFCQIFNI